MKNRKQWNVPFSELDQIGEGISKSYTDRTGSGDSMCIDIEGLLTDYLGLDLRYEKIAEEGGDVLGFYANGRDPLAVIRDGVPRDEVFPEGTVVIERDLLREEQSARRRFTMAHEAAHDIVKKLYPGQSVQEIYSDPEALRSSTPEEIEECIRKQERGMNRLGASILMARYKIERFLKEHHSGELICCYGDGIFSLEDRICIQKMANDMGASFTAMVIQLRDLDMLEYRPVEEFIENGILR